MSRSPQSAVRGRPRPLAAARNGWRHLPSLARRELLREARSRWRTRGVQSIGWRCIIEGRPLVNPEHITIGERVTIRRNAELLAKPGEPIVLGNWTGINQGVIIRPGTTIGERVSIGFRAMLLTDSHEVGDAYRRAGANYTGPITVGDGAWIGAGAIILPGVTIGEGAVIGAGAVVTGDCEPHGVYMGVPARLVRTLSPE